MERNGWVVVFQDSEDYIEINLVTGQTASYGRVIAGKPERLELGQLSDEALAHYRKLFADDARED